MEYIGEVNGKLLRHELPEVRQGCFQSILRYFASTSEAEASGITHLELYALLPIAFADVAGSPSCCENLPALESLALSFSRWNSSRTCAEKQRSDHPNTTSTHTFDSSLLDWLRSSRQTLRTLYLSFKKNIGVYPRWDLDAIIPKHLTKLALKRVVLTSQPQIESITDYVGLDALELIEYLIVVTVWSFEELDDNGLPIFSACGIVSTIDLLVSKTDLIPHHYDLRWSAVFAQLQTLSKLKYIRVLGFGAGDEWKEDKVPWRWQSKRYQRSGCGIYDGMAEATTDHEPSADKDQEEWNKLVRVIQGRNP